MLSHNLIFSLDSAQKNSSKSHEKINQTLFRSTLFGFHVIISFLFMENNKIELQQWVKMYGWTIMRVKQKYLKYTLHMLYSNERKTYQIPNKMCYFTLFFLFWLILVIINDGY